MKMKTNMGKMLFFLLLLSHLACNTQKKAEANKDCDTEGIVRDFTGLDGCKLLIVLGNGDKLLPGKINDPSFVLEAGQHIRFNYRQMEDMMSICMAEDMIVEISCIELVKEELPVKAECFEIADPTVVSWMMQAIKKHRPLKVLRYVYRTDGWAYLLKGDNTYLYDCQGSLLCQTEGPAVEACMKLIGKGKTGKVIYQAEGIKE